VLQMTSHFLPEHPLEPVSGGVEISSRTIVVSDHWILWINDCRTTSTKQMDHAFVADKRKSDNSLN
jgi:hypothetical protein